jgi:hypothetical protein
MTNIVERLRLNEDDWLFGNTARTARVEIETLTMQRDEALRQVAVLREALEKAVTRIEDHRYSINERYQVGRQALSEIRLEKGTLNENPNL